MQQVALTPADTKTGIIPNSPKSTFQHSTQYILKMAELTSDELSCIYASLILIDDDVAVTGEKIQTLLKAANVKVAPYWPGLFANAVGSMDAKTLLGNVGSAMPSASPAAAAGGDAAAPAAKEEEKKQEEEEEESDEDLGMSLFD